ncbi:uncharacterized protein LOC141915509 [Tubulanus polymorphus]|uniref:uncharacterized protein LOC141915509 n=1 Tax=Tubulanus polymorphus TaxID=672921 RepID=UPI003DA3E5FA
MNEGVDNPAYSNSDSPDEVKEFNAYSHETGAEYVETNPKKPLQMQVLPGAPGGIFGLENPTYDYRVSNGAQRSVDEIDVNIYNDLQQAADRKNKNIRYTRIACIVGIVIGVILGAAMIGSLLAVLLMKDDLTPGPGPNPRNPASGPGSGSVGILMSLKVDNEIFHPTMADNTSIAYLSFAKEFLSAVDNIYKSDPKVSPYYKHGIITDLSNGSVIVDYVISVMNTVPADIGNDCRETLEKVAGTNSGFGRFRIAKGSVKSKGQKHFSKKDKQLLDAEYKRIKEADSTGGNWNNTKNVDPIISPELADIVKCNSKIRPATVGACSTYFNKQIIDKLLNNTSVDQTNQCRYSLH